MKSNLEFQWETINTLSDSIYDLHNTAKELNIKNELLENAIEQITQSSLEFNRNSIGKSNSYSEEVPHPKRKVKLEQKNVDHEDIDMGWRLKSNYGVSITFPMKIKHPKYKVLKWICRSRN